MVVLDLRDLKFKLGQLQNGRKCVYEPAKIFFYRKTDHVVQLQVKKEVHQQEKELVEDRKKT